MANKLLLNRRTKNLRKLQWVKIKLDAVQRLKHKVFENMARSQPSTQSYVILKNIQIGHMYYHYFGGHTRKWRQLKCLLSFNRQTRKTKKGAPFNLFVALELFYNQQQTSYTVLSYFLYLYVNLRAWYLIKFSMLFYSYQIKILKFLLTIIVSKTKH